MNISARRITATAVLTIAPALFAVGLAGAGHAETTTTNTGPAVSAPAHKMPSEPGVPSYLHPNRHHHNHTMGR